MDVIDKRPPTLTDVPNLWKFDGGLRDIYVLGTTLEDWRCFVALALSCPYQYDGELTLPPDVESVLRDDQSHRLLVHVGNVGLSCNFFDVSEIEIDIVPDEVETEADHDGILEFLARLGRALGKPVILTLENEIHTPIVSFDPSNNAWRWKADWSAL
jgi:hypothetical protein